jgi:enamine deaminase RidA (YjgF/YER057c/UK114 family)
MSLIARTTLTAAVLALAAARVPAGPVPLDGPLAKTEVRFLNPPTLAPIDFASHVATVTHGRRLVHIAGQTSVNTEFRVVGEDIATQTPLALKNLDLALAAANAGRADVVQVMVLFVGTQPSDAAPLRAQLREYFKGRPLPAATYVGVPRLVADGMLVEIEALAVLPE